MEADLQLGPTADGGYNTPYAVTVFYNELDLFQTGVAVFAARSQAIPVSSACGDENLADVPEHPSPDLVVFGQIPGGADAYFRRGFQRVLLIANESDAASTHVDPRVVTITYAQLFTGYVEPIESMNAFYIMELLSCGRYPAHISQVNDVTHEDGKLFSAYIKRTFGKGAAAEIFRLGTRFNGFDIAAKYCERERGIAEERLRIAKLRITKAVTRDDCVFVYGGDLRNELVSIASGGVNAPGVSTGVTASTTAPTYTAIVYVGESDDSSGQINVLMFARSNGNAVKKLRELTLAEVHGSETSASCVSNLHDAKKFAVL